MITVLFSAPDFNLQRNPKREDDNDLAVTVKGLNIDFSRLTLIPQNHNEDLQVAIPSPYMNEDGEECGEIAWRIEPETKLLTLMPELGPYVGCIYGFVTIG